MFGSGPGAYFLSCLLKHVYNYSGPGRSGSGLFFFFYLLSGAGPSGPGLLFFVAWYEWARYDVGQLTRENVYFVLRGLYFVKRRYQHGGAGGRGRAWVGCLKTQ